MQDELYGFVRQQVTELPGFTECYCYEREGLVAAEISEQLYRPLSLRLEEVELQQGGIGDYAVYFKELGCRFLLFVWREKEEERLYFFSSTGQVRALEFVDYLIPEFGLVKGAAECAGGRISSAILRVQMAGMELSDTMEYFLKMSASYFEDCEQINAEEYGREHQEEIRRMPQYVKKRLPWAYVKSTDIVEPGSCIRIRSLENESGIVITASPEVYIMIGCRGEVYDMQRDKFECTYEPTEEPLDVFERMMDCLPEAELVPEGSFVSLDGLAHLCYPLPGAGIYARRLTKRSKVYPAGSDEGYYLGREGDYLAVRMEDMTDIYVIQEDIFAMTYEKQQGGEVG